MAYPTVDAALTAIEERAALLHYLADAATNPIQPPDRLVLGGLSDLCGEIARLAGRVRGSLDAAALDTETR